MGEEHITKIAKLRTFFYGFLYFNFLDFGLVFLGSVYVNQPTVHSGGVSMGRACGCWRL